MRQLIGKLSRTAAPTGLPVAAVAVFALTDAVGLGVLLCAATLALSLRAGEFGLGRQMLSRSLAIAALLLESGALTGAAIAGVALLGLVAFEPRLEIALTTKWLETANLPVRRDGRRMSPGVAYGVIWALTASFDAVTAWHAAAAPGAGLA
ncbi:MAG: hypothetical protein ACRDXX_16780, partial [Stackebrandtia sp.]